MTLAIYTACEDLDFLWDWRDVTEFDRMWSEGFSLEDIARAFNRDIDEASILAIDRCKQGHIEPRPGGVQGRRMPSG